MLPDSRVRQRDYLLEISRAITQELDLDNLLGRILDISIEMVAGQSGVIVLRTESKGWHIHVSHGMPSPFLKYIEPFLVEIPSHPENAEIFEVPEINRIFTELTHAASMGMLTSVGLPLITHNSVLGVIFIFRSHPGGFSNNDTALLRSFADQAAIAVQNAKLYTEITHEKKRMDALLDSAADGILILTADHRIQHCNHALSRMLMINSTGIRDHKFEQIIQWASPPHGLTLEQAEAGGWPLTPHANLYTEGDLISPFIRRGWRITQYHSHSA
jgi:GAF domain-containing protein